MIFPARIRVAKMNVESGVNLSDYFRFKACKLTRVKMLQTFLTRYSSQESTIDEKMLKDTSFEVSSLFKENFLSLLAFPLIGFHRCSKFSVLLFLSISYTCAGKHFKNARTFNFPYERK